MIYYNYMNNYFLFFSVIVVIFICTILFANMFKVAQYKHHLGVKLNVFLVLFQIAQINKWLKTIPPRSYPSFKAYYNAFAKINIDNFTILNADDFRQDVYGNIIFVGQAISFKEFKNKVNVFLDKPLEKVLLYSELIDVKKLFNNYHLPYNENMPKYSVGEVQRTDLDIYIRMKIFALGIAYINALQINNNQDKIFVLKEMKNTYDKYKEHFTKTDVKLFLNKLSQNELINYSWNMECLYILCYICDIEENYLFPNSPCTLDLYSKLVQVNPSEVKLNKQKALDMLEIYHAFLWTKREYALKGKNLNINEEIVTERYRALIWLFEDEPFDEIVCDT